MAAKKGRVATEHISVSLPKGMKGKLDVAAKDVGVTRTGAVVMAVMAWPRYNRAMRDRREDAERGSAPHPEGRKKRRRKKGKTPE